MKIVSEDQYFIRMTGLTVDDETEEINIQKIHGRWCILRDNMCVQDFNQLPAAKLWLNFNVWAADEL